MGSLPRSLGATECRRETQQAKTGPRGPVGQEKSKEKGNVAWSGQDRSGGGQGQAWRVWSRDSAFQFLPKEPALQASAAPSWLRWKQAQLQKLGQDRCQCQPEALVWRRVIGSE